MIKKGLRLAVLLTFYLFYTSIGSIFFSGPANAAKFLESFDLPAGPLSEALIQFANQSEISLLVSKSAVADLSVNNIKGVMTLSQALDRLLESTGLGYKFLDRNTVSISRAFAPAHNHLANKNADTKKNQRDESAHTIEEITVTAGRRAENLQKVPIAVSVLNDLTLQVSDIQDLTDIASRAPGLTVSSFSLGQPSIHMRGIGSNDDGAAMDNSVVVFLDDVYIGRISTLDLNVLDLERVEVLRGPQGTLYGRNAIGGAIKMISKAPTAEPEARLQLSAGNYRAAGINLLVNGSLGKHWQGRLSLDARQRDGWQNNSILNLEKQHAYSSWVVRSQLRHNPNESLAILWSADLSRDNRNSSGRIPVQGRVPVRILDSNNNRIPLLDDNGSPLLDNNLQPLYATQLPTTIFSNLGGNPKNATNGEQGFTDRDIWGLNQRITQQSEAGNWISITSYRDSDFNWLEDSIGIPSSATDQTVNTHVNESHRQFSQEFRWASVQQSNTDPADQPISYVMGIYTLYEHTNRLEQFPFFDSVARTHQDNRTNSYAMFGQLDYQLNSKARLTLGGRYSRDTKKLHQESLNGGAPSIILENFELSSQKTWQDFSPRFALSYNLSDSQLMYGSISRGMKSGGFQGAPGTLELALRTIDPESAWTHELGFKSLCFQDRLRLNLAGFYTDYQDLQVVQFQTVDNFGLFQTDNAASATVRGLEFEFDAHLSNNLTFTGSYAYLNATYDNFDDLDGRDFTGNQLRQAPKHTANLTLHYEQPFASGDLRLHADFRYQSKSYREPDNSITQQPSFQLLDASISYLASNNHWEAKLWAKNLLDEQYITHLYILGGNDFAIYGTPRTYGLTLTWHIQ